MTYRHLTYADRVAMETLLNRKCSKADVARYLKVSRATITREYKKRYIYTYQFRSNGNRKIQCRSCTKKYRLCTNQQGATS